MLLLDKFKLRLETNHAYTHHDIKNRNKRKNKWHNIRLVTTCICLLRLPINKIVSINIVKVLL